MLYNLIDVTFDAAFFVMAGILTILFEAVACVGRFGLGIRSREHIVPLTLGVRIHHGYIGGVLWILALIVSAPMATYFGALGAALVVSDLIHHFVVLPIATGQLD